MPIEILIKKLQAHMTRRGLTLSTGAAPLEGTSLSSALHDLAEVLSNSEDDEDFDSAPTKEMPRALLAHLRAATTQVVAS